MERGEAVYAVCTKWQITSSTLYEWRGLYRGMSTEAVAQLERLRRENAEFKRQLTICEQDREMLMAVLLQFNRDVSDRCLLVNWLLRHHRVSLSRACRLANLSRSLFLARSAQ